MSTEDIKRKLTAIFSADVEGYSRLMGEDELATVQTLTSYLETMKKLIRHYRGRVVDSTGDNLLAEFASVVDAVQCAVEVQQVIKGKNEDLPENRRMLFRIGINLGDVIEEGDRIFGDGVNIAARVESLSEGGGVCISGSAYEQIENKLALGYQYMGEHAVKNIAKPIKVWKVPMGPVAIKKKAAVRGWHKAAIAAAAVVILAGVAGIIWHYYFRPPPIEPASVEKMAFELPEKPSIAVLPFVNMSGDPEQEYIADGITENITTALSKIPEMFVIARTSTMTYKGKPVKVKQVSEELGVRYVLEGSVQKEGDRVRITAQLVDAIKGHHLWAESYDRDMKGFFDLLDEMTKEIGAALQVKLTWGDYARYMASTDNFEAWGYFNKGSSLFQLHTKGDNAKAREYFQKALELDPKYIRAICLIAWTHLFDLYFGWSKSPGQSMELAEELTQKAQTIDESDPGVPTLWCSIYRAKGQYEKSIAEGERAIALDPNFAIAYVILAGSLNDSGRFEEAIARLKTGIRLWGPYYPPINLESLGAYYRNAGRYEEAISEYKKLLDRCHKGEYPLIRAHLGLASTYMMAGQEEKARAHAAEVLKINPNYSLETLRKAARYKDPAHTERIIDAYRKAGIPAKPPGAVPDKPSIAVLPFANISGDPKEDYLSDGITEQIITALSKIPQMLVIARNSVFTYKGKPVMVQQVSEELGVRYVLEGSVQRSGDRLRITAQLIDAKTGNHIWSERYDRDLKDLFELQDDITKNVITALQVKLTAGQTASALAKGTNNLEAYLKVMKGLHHFSRFNKDDNEIARQLCEEAIALDSNYANAYVILAWTYWQEVNSGWAKTPAKSYEKAVELAKKAISLDEQSAGSYMVLANVYAKTRQFEKAAAAQKKALSLDPGSSGVNALSGLYLYNSGQFKEAIQFFKKAIRMDPKPPSWYPVRLGWAYFYTGQNEEAVTVFEKLVSREPQNDFSHASLGCALINTGKPEEAVEMFEKASSLNPIPTSWYIGELAIARVGLGNIEKARAGLREVLSSHPDNAWAYRGLSAVLIYEGKYEEALSMAEKAIRLKAPPEAPPYYCWFLAVPYLMIGEYEEAITAFKKSINPWPEYMDGRIGLTASYSMAGRMEQARAQATEVLRINPKITLEDIAKNGYYNFQKADKERFINALRKAGLR